MEKYKWFPFVDLNNNNTTSKYKLFCFHHAGGSASIYGAWMMYKKDIDIY